MAKEFYKQCTLIQKSDTGVTKVVTWIPEEGAEINKTMKLKDPISKEWKEGRWTVKIVGTQRLSSQAIKERIRIARKYRASTDI